MWRAVALLTCCACSRKAPPEADVAPPTVAASSDVTPRASTHASPPWPTSPEAAAPPGSRWTTIHHETIHVRVLVPDGVQPELAHDANGYPLATIPLADVRPPIHCQFSSGLDHAGQTMRRTPPVFYGLKIDASRVTDDTIAVRYHDSTGGLRIHGYAPGVSCTFEPFGEVPAAILDHVFSIVASVHSPPPGPWRESTGDERAHGGMTDVPDGAWVEGSLPQTTGSRLLRTGPFVASMYVGGLRVSSRPCPTRDEARTIDKPEVAVTVEPRGDGWVRIATEEYEGVRFPAPTTVWLPAGSRCCLATFLPWLDPPAPAKLDYAIALCRTFRQ